MNSLRVLTALSMELVSIVPFSAQDTFAHDSQEPVSQLFNSYEDLEQGDVAVDALRGRIFVASLEDAVADRLDAAKHELSGLPRFSRCCAPPSTASCSW